MMNTTTTEERAGVADLEWEDLMPHIHTPPPPANQIVRVLPGAPVPPEQAIFPVWMTGTLRTVAAVTAEGATGYRIDNAQVEPYPWKRRR